MATSHDTSGYKLFADLYKKKRAKDGRRELQKKEFDEKTASHWKSLPADKRKRYTEEAIKRTKRAAAKKDSTHSRRHISSKHRAPSISPPRRGRRYHRSPSYSRSRRDYSRSRSSSDSSARNEYLGGRSSRSYYSSDTSYTDTVSTYYDDERDCSDATSCTSIAASYDEFSDDGMATDYDEPKTVVKKTIKRKSLKKVKEPVKVVRKARQTRQSKVAIAATKVPTAATKIPATTARGRPRGSTRKRKAVADTTTAAVKEEVTKASKPTTPGAKRKRRPAPLLKRTRKLRATRAATKKAIPLKKTPASLSVNIKLPRFQEEVQRRGTPPPQSFSDSKIKAMSTEAKPSPVLPPAEV